MSQSHKNQPRLQNRIKYDELAYLDWDIHRLVALTKPKQDNGKAHGAMVVFVK